MKPKISLITITSRDLYIPYVIDSLKTQSLQDFEFIVVDDLFEQHHEEFVKRVDGKFPFIHRTPKEVVPYYAASAAMNSGIVCASGELVLFNTDYIIPHHDCLRRHWEVHQKYPKYFISGKCLEVEFTPDKLQQEGTYRGADYRTGLFMHSCFSWSRIEEKLFASGKEGVQNWWAGRNDSAPLEALLECNGFDESMDGRHGYQDEDMAQRMQILGYHYLIDMESVALMFPHEKATKQTLRSESDQQYFKDRLIPYRISHGIYRVNEARDLRKEREEWLKLHLVSG